MEIAADRQKDAKEKRYALNAADVVFLCLPDDAARESVSLIENPTVYVIDGSTAHRTADGWTYGLPELDRKQRLLIRSSRRISVPGCHATGFNAIVYPLVKEGLISRQYPLSCYSITGYSGGGKPMIAQYEAVRPKDALKAPRLYSLALQHKHLPEMQKIPGLASPPVFTPIVGGYYQGEVVSVPLHARLLSKGENAASIQRLYEDYYAGEVFISVLPYPPSELMQEGYMDPMTCNGTNRLEIIVFGNDEQVLVSARFDNLGKGASGAAVQNMNVVIGASESYGLQ